MNERQQALAALTKKLAGTILEAMPHATCDHDVPCA